MTTHTGIRDYKDLIVWQKSMELVTRIYALTAGFPSSERFGLTAQMRRAAVSVPSNIAEGQSRSHQPEFRQFLSIALGSAGELETQILIATRLQFISANDSTPLCESINEIRRMLRGLVASTYKERRG